MVQIIGYGEDALTLWVLAHHLETILRPGDNPAGCRVFFRASFGRRGGVYSAQFGEFDFIILADQRIYLGESKWVRTQTCPDFEWRLESPQDARHTTFRAYVERALTLDPRGPAFFDPDVSICYQRPMPRSDTLLANNLRTVLGDIHARYDAESKPEMWDVMLLLHKGLTLGEATEPRDHFRIIPIDYTEATERVDATGHFVCLDVS